MKNYTKYRQTEYDQVKPESFNTNGQKQWNTYNGALDGTNLPIDSVGGEQLKVPTLEEFSKGGGDVSYTKWESQTQKIHYIRHYTGYEGGINDLLADTEIIFSTSNWHGNWNRLYDQTNYTDFYIEIDTEPGVLSGWFQFNYRHGLNVLPDSGGGGNFVFGYDWYTDWGIFVNDRLVVESGHLRPRGEALAIPFHIPVGKGTQKIDVRFRPSTSGAGSVTGVSYAGDPSTYLQIYSASIYVNNTFK